MSACSRTLASLLLLTTASAAADEGANRLNQEITFDIEPQPLDAALLQLAQQANVQVLFAAGEFRGQQSKGVKGKTPTVSALGELLQDTGLVYQTVGDNTVAIKPADTESQRPLDRPTLRLAQNQSSGRQQARPQQHAIDELEEVVVTAQKRTERLLDVPFSVGAVSGERLESLGVTSLTDLSGYVPGLSVTNSGAPGFRSVVLRGLSDSYYSSFAAPLVATYIDDISIGNSGGSRSGGARSGIIGLDLLPYDIERIEILRGPQGTLYGANAVGGVIKYSLRKPNLKDFEAAAGAGLESVNWSGGPGWIGRASVDAPLVVDRLGLRVSGFHQRTAGYIDNVGTGSDDANSASQSGGRATLLWQLTDQLTLQATALGQNIDSDDMTAVTLDEATLRPIYGSHASRTRVPQTFEQKTRAYSVTVDWDLGFANLTSASSWSRLVSSTDYDLSFSFGPFVPGNPDATAVFIPQNEGSKFAQEVRLVSRSDQRLQWLLGGFFTKEDSSEIDSFPTFTPAGDPVPANLLLWDIEQDYTERAAFGNVTYAFTERFDIGGGLRYAKNKDSQCLESGGLFGSGVQPCTSRPYDAVTTWMANARFRIMPNAMLYVRAATGYRPGSGCETCGLPSLGIPGIYEPDEITNYEAGFKGEFLNRRLQFDLSAFHIDWKDMQLQQLTDQGFNYVVNGGTAASDGFELTTGYRADFGLQVNATLAYTDARLTEDAPPGAGGMEGDQLPGSARWAGSVTTDQSVALDERWTLMIDGAYRYKGRVYSQFPSSLHPLPIKPQSIIDVYAGLVGDRVTTRVFVKNLFAARSYAGLWYLDNPQTPMFVPVQPRTFGLSIDYQF